MRDDCITVALGLPEVKVVREEETDRGITVEVGYRAQSVLCPGCGQRTPKVHSVSLQWKRDRRLRDKPLFLVLHKRRFRCLACRKVFTEPDPRCLGPGGVAASASESIWGRKPCTRRYAMWLTRKG